MPLAKLEAARRALATDTVEGARMEELKGELSEWRRDVERAYHPRVRKEPLFVQLKGKQKLFTTKEMHTSTVGEIFKDCG